MVNKLIGVQDIASGTFALIMVATLATTVLLLAGTAWVPRRWKLPLALSGIVTLASAAHYLIATNVWLATAQMTMIYRYIGWFLTVPLQVVTLYFFVGAVGPVPVGVFWRLLVAAVLMVLSRFMGEADLMHSALGFLIGLVTWLYILGEAFFGWMSKRVLQAGSDPVRKGFFWLRLIITIGSGIYPLCYFIASFTGDVEIRYLMVTYNLADFVNQIAFGLIILAVGMKESVSL
ncbi:MAG: bacteriorhodopsin [Desulfobacterales bacterium]|nr:MAG: bacteriorhodopsin [Desulfobacterales bacterium]